MKLFFDARYIRTDFHDGISRYSTELGTAIARIDPTITFLIHNDTQRTLLPKNAICILIHPPTSTKEPLTAFIINKYRPDVVFSPMQTMGSMGRKFKLILTSHDMIYYRHRTPPSQLSAALKLGWRAYHLSYVPQRLSLNSADLIATVSETSKSDFEQAHLTHRPIVVIPNAPQKLSQFLAAPVKHDTVTNLIYMGSFMPYKNVEALIRGMEFLPDHTLHLLSRISDARKNELAKNIPEGARVIFHGGVTDEAYAALLADNAILVSASLDEGYGLPLAEALELAVPAVVSNLPIFHEVAAGGALYFDPKDPRAFADRVLELSIPDNYENRAKDGKAHIATYSWDTSAKKLITAAHSLLTPSVTIE